MATMIALAISSTFWGRGRVAGIVSVSAGTAGLGFRAACIITLLLLGLLLYAIESFSYYVVNPMLSAVDIANVPYPTAYT